MNDINSKVRLSIFHISRYAQPYQYDMNKNTKQKTYMLMR